MSLRFLQYRPPVSVRLAAGLSLLAVSCILLSDHAAAVRRMRDTGLPAAVELPVLEQRMRMLKEQNEVAELQAALSTGSMQEMLDAYVLPSGTGSVRTLTQLDTLFTFLRQSHELFDVSAVSVGQRTNGSGNITVVPFTFSAHLTRDGWKKMLLFTDVSGVMTVEDMVDDATFTELLSLTEQENPATIAALEQFFSADLLRYSEEPRPFHEALLKSFSSDASLQAIHTFLDTPRLQSVRSFLAPISKTLRANRLWPLQFLQMQEVSQHVRDDGTLDVTVTVGAYGRMTK